MANQPTGTIYQPGDFIGQSYEVHSVLGMGGFGVVYLVHDLKFMQLQALKTFHDEFLVDAKIRDLFKKEANTLVALEQHPYLVHAYSVDEISGRLFIAMEYIAPNEQGINSLAGYLQNRPPNLAQSLRWAIQVCFGMEYAYSKGIRTHRDLKPENIMIAQDSTAKITDFGLAGILDSLPANSTRPTGNIGQFGKTQIGTGFGTPTHMPPEQFIDAASCDVRSDIYAFGVVLFQMASGGEPPFLAIPPRDGSQEERMRFGLDMQQLHNEARVPRLNSPLFPIIQHCLEKKPDKRYQSFAQLRSDLEPMLKKQNGEVIRPPQVENVDVFEFNNKGVSLANLGRIEEAIICFDQALKIDPRHVTSLNNKALILNNLGRYEEAVRCLDKALKIDPRYAKALNNKAVSLKNLGRYEEAIRYCDKALEIDPRYAKALTNKGNSLGRLGRDEEAIRCYDKALKIDPRLAATLSNKGNSLNNLDRYEEAIRYIDKALEIDPLNVDALVNKGNSLNSLGRYEDAIRCLDKALKIDPCNAKALNNKGNSLNGLRRYEEAIHYYDKALEIDPRFMIALNNKGNSLNSLGRYEEAIRYLDQALELDPCYVNAWYNKGRSLGGLGRDEESIRYYDKAAEYMKEIEVVRQRRKELEGGQVNLLTKIQRFSRTRALNKKGNSLFKRGSFAEAIHCYNQVLEIDSRNAWASGHKGIAEEALGRKREAAQTYRQFLALLPAHQTETIEYVRQRIRELEGG
jgi:tetratricopeptide (TPR) repeat protein